MNHDADAGGQKHVSLRAKEWGLDEDSLEFARRMDQEDELREFRQLFNYPKKRNIPGVDANRLRDENEEAIYFCGHSLGLPLKSMESCLHEIVKNWAERGVLSHFHGCLPVAYCDLPIKEKMAQVVGAHPDEIAAMNALTVNIHVMLSSFYKPNVNRYKILMIQHGFPSDRFAVESQVRLRGLDPEKTIIYLQPRENEETINPRDVIATIEKEGSSIALIFLEGVHYYTGQLFDMKHITEVGHQQGCVVGFDLAHAVGNVKLELHDWDVDFAAWCTYKYMNCGAGSLSAVYVNNKYTSNGISNTFPMLRGWWGVSPETKFAMDKDFDPANGADRFKLSNPSPFLSVMVLANLEVFDEAGIDALVRKQRKLTGYLEYLVKRTFQSESKMGVDLPSISIITPNNPKCRGCQLSLKSSIPLDVVEQEFLKRGVVCDIRLPSVIRVTPVPLYNSFEEVYQFVHTLKEIFAQMKREAL